MAKRRRSNPSLYQPEKKGRDLDKWRSNTAKPRDGTVRIIGGEFRGRLIKYSGDPITRPMKASIREAVFNLVGGWIPGKYVFDLFAGTGAIGIEGISRGAVGATLIERHFPTAKIIKENIELLDIEQLVQQETADSFFWIRQFFKNSQTWPTQPWAVFCSPPYRFYSERKDELLDSISQFKKNAPPNSLIVVESDESFDPAELPDADQWKTRQYSPARIAVWRDDSDESHSTNAAT